MILDTPDLKMTIFGVLEVLVASRAFAMLFSPLLFWLRPRLGLLNELLSFC